MGQPCGWTVEQCGCGGCFSDSTPAVRAVATTLATTVMWAATGRRYGPCELTVMPCNPGPAEPLYQTFPVGSGYDPWGSGGGPITTPVLDAGRWRNLSCGGGCSCRAACEVPLDGPVDEIFEVRVDGVVVDPAAYEVHDRHLLVRTDGECWPTCQVYGLEIPGFEVDYGRGDPVPSAVLVATGILMCEYAKACQGKPCGLPARMSRLTRQGVEVQVAEIPQDGKGRIRTGIRLVDDVLDADNPYGLAERPTVMSPDLPAPRVITWRAGS